MDGMVDVRHCTARESVASFCGLYVVVSDMCARLSCCWCELCLVVVGGRRARE